MKKEYVYFFKHNDISAIKIGKTSGESVLDRFKSFKTYSPFGSEIVGFFETDDGHRDERELHARFENLRLHGEFFDISKDVVKGILHEKNADYNKSLKIFNEWIADNNNDSDKLLSLMKEAGQNDKIKKSKIISDKVLDYINAGNFGYNVIYEFGKEYKKLLSHIHPEKCSVMAFKRSLLYAARQNGLVLETKRNRQKYNRHEFFFKDE